MKSEVLPDKLSISNTSILPLPSLLLLRVIQSPFTEPPRYICIRLLSVCLFFNGASLIIFFIFFKQFQLMFTPLAIPLCEHYGPLLVNLRRFKAHPPMTCQYFREGKGDEAVFTDRLPLDEHYQAKTLFRICSLWRHSLYLFIFVWM